MKIIPTPRFKRAYQNLPKEVQLSVDDALRKFLTNPRHPGLHFEKLKGSDYRTIRVDRGRWRIVMKGEGGEMLIVDVDRHQSVDRKYG